MRNPHGKVSLPMAHLNVGKIVEKKDDKRMRMSVDKFLALMYPLFLFQIIPMKDKNKIGMKNAISVQATIGTNIVSHLDRNLNNQKCSCWVSNLVGNEIIILKDNNKIYQLIPLMKEGTQQSHGGECVIDIEEDQSNNNISSSSIILQKVFYQQNKPRNYSIQAVGSNGQHIVNTQQEEIQGKRNDHHNKSNYQYNNNNRKDKIKDNRGGGGGFNNNHREYKRNYKGRNENDRIHEPPVTNIHQPVIVNQPVKPVFDNESNFPSLKPKEKKEPPLKKKENKKKKSESFSTSSEIEENVISNHSTKSSNEKSNDLVEYGSVELNWINMEIGNFDDSKYETFLCVNKDQVGHGMLERSVSLLFWSPTGDMKLQATFNSKHEYWMDIKRDNIRRVIVGVTELAIELRNVPFIYRKRPDEEFRTRMAAPDYTQQDSISSMWLNNFRWGRSLLLTVSSDVSSLLKSHTYPFQIFTQEKKFNKKHIDTLQYDESLDFPLQDFPFNTVYLLFCLDTKIPGLLHSRERLEAIKETFIDYINNNHAFEWIDRAMREILNEKHIYPTEFLDQFKKHMANQKSKHNDMTFIDFDTNFFSIRKVMVTPTGWRFFDKSVEGGNRVLRKYKEKNEDHFLRITFCDEDLHKLSAEKFTNLHERIEIVLKKGLLVYNRKYEMLAYSTSQLRAHSSWFIHSNGSFTPRNVINSLGNFSHIKVKARYAARIGQCFSHTYEGISKEYDIFEDITRNRYVFTDGVGRISPKFALELAKKFQISYAGKEYVPSAFQFRMGGLKGVVVVDPEIHLHTNKDLLLSRSQEKFIDNSSNEFELITYSKRNRYASLNRQLIALLSSNKIPDRIFLNLLDRDLNEIKKVFNDKKYMRRVLRKSQDNIIVKNMKKVASFNYLDDQYDFSKVVQNGENIKFFYQIEPVFCNIKDSLIRNRLNDLKNGRIILDKALLLMGVVDFYGVLEEDEVFVQLSGLESCDSDLYDDDDSCYVNGGILSGTIAITRSPCLHPGDIRKFKAVTDPEKIKKLSHIKDVVVFSQKGYRPAANKLSGGDYDGDFFQIFWDPELVNFEEYPPMNYEGLTPEQKQDGCDYRVIREFLTEYIINDNLGVVAFLHLEHYDKEKDGLRSQACLRLAKHHSYQVDYAKTGVRKPLPTDLLSNSRPHYMPRVFGKKTYHSEDIIGNIYDKVIFFEKTIHGKKLDILDAIKETTIDPHLAILDNIFIKLTALKKILIDEDWSNFDGNIMYAYDDISIIYQDYKTDLRKLMQQYFVTSEVELLGGFFNTKELEVRCGKNYFKLKVEISEIVKQFTKYYHGKAIEVLNKYCRTIPRQAVATAFYIAVRNDNKDKKLREFFGITFYWLVMDEIVSFESIDSPPTL